jgi:hypothetical protein
MSGFDFRNMSNPNASSAMDSANIAAQTNNVQNPFTDKSLGYTGAAEELGLTGSSSGMTDLSGAQGSAMLNSMGLNARGAATNPNQLNALLYAGQLLNQGQPQRQSMPSFGQIKPAQQPNITDPVGALLAPKRKKKEPISLL